MTLQKISNVLADRLELQVSAPTVLRLLSQLNYSLKENSKSLSQKHPDRDEQFDIITNLRCEFTSTDDPVLSVDTKKKELIGNFKNTGKEWCGKAKVVNDHDFRSCADGIASPYGIYDVNRNFGVVVVGKSADTPEFAVNSIATWWKNFGQIHYPDSKRVLILADSGGSNGARPRAFKKFLQERIAEKYGLEVTMAHYPAGASKWNPIEHRMFSEISKNWAGQPLKSFETVVNFINDTKTEPGLRIKAYLDEREYVKGIKVSDEEFKSLKILKRSRLGNWNYTISASSSSH